MKCRKILVWLTSCLAIIALILVGASFYFFNVACVPGQKNFISRIPIQSKSLILYIKKKSGILIPKSKSGI